MQVSGHARLAADPAAISWSKRLCCLTSWVPSSYFLPFSAFQDWNRARRSAGDCRGRGREAVLSKWPDWPGRQAWQQRRRRSVRKVGGRAARAGQGVVQLGRMMLE